MTTLTRPVPSIEVSTLSAWLDSLVDFRPYLEQFIREHEKSAIPKYYVDLTCSRVEVRNDTIVRDKWQFKPIDSLVEQWLAEPGAGHLSILGDFGTGKTWFARRFAYRKAREYFARRPGARIPVFLDLSNFKPTEGIEAFIARDLARHGVRMRHPIETLHYLNEQGKLLLILDSFDQLAQHADSHNITVQNFWELSRLVHGKSKIILMCRTHYFRHLAQEVAVLRPILKSIKVPVDRYQLGKLATSGGGYRLVHLLPLEPEDVKLALQKRIPNDYESVYDKIQSIYDLGGLAGRPVLLDLIAEIFPRIENVESVNQLILYETYFQEQYKRNFRPGVSPLTPQQRHEFASDLAWHMFVTQHTSISPEAFSTRVREFFDLPDSRMVRQCEQDLRTQLYLVRDDEGNIRFGHESFKEFLVAQRVARRLQNGGDLASMLGATVSITGERLYLRGIYKFVNLMLKPGDERHLLRLVESPHAWERFLAIYLLGRPKDPQYQDIISETLSRHVDMEPNVMTRRETCYALARLGQEQFLHDFVKEVKQDRQMMQEVYQKGYFDYHHDRGGPVEEMRWRLVNRVDQGARIEYIHFLGEYGDARCISAIEPYLQDPHEDVRLEAQEALGKLRARLPAE